MSVSGLFTIGTSALHAAYAQLQVTGNNIANVDTPGYSRQTAVLATTGSTFRGGGFYGRGVDVVTVARLYDRFLGERVQSGTAMAAGDAARASALSQLETLIGREGGGVGIALDSLRLSIADLAARPADASARTVVLGRMQAVAQTFQTLSSGIETQAASLEARIADGARHLNGLLGQVAGLNAALARDHVPGQLPADLLDRRDALIGEISALVQVSARFAEDGSVALAGAGGYALVSAQGAASFGVQPDPFDATRSRLMLKSAGTTVPVSSGMLGAGQLAGLMRFRDNDLTAARNALGQLAGAVAGAWNDAHAQGVDATGTPGGDLFRIAAPRVDAALDNAGSAAFTVAITDASNLAASDYSLEWDGSQYALTRLADGQRTMVGAWPAAIDGLRIDAPTGIPAAGDRYLLRSASVMAGGFAALPIAAQRLATGLPLTTTSGAGNGGDLTASGLQLIDPGNPSLAAPVTISFDGAGSFSVSGAGTGNPVGLAYLPGMTVSFNGWSLVMDGQPAAGDTLVVSATAEPDADNRNALNLLGLGDRTLVAGRSFTDAWAQVLGDVGERSRSMQGAASLSQALLADARMAQGSMSGVNLDEEAARLLQYQQSYQAAAKVIAAAQSVFDTLLGIAR